MVNIKNTKSRSLSKSKQGSYKKQLRKKSLGKIKKTKTVRRRRNKNRKSFKKGGSKNGCGNNQRLVYDAEGLIGCSKPFGSPYQGGQKFVFPTKIKSI